MSILPDDAPQYFTSVEKCADEIIRRLDKRIVFGLGSGVGKGVGLMNEIYRRAKADPTIDLAIISALTLEMPKPANELQARFMGPMLERIFEDVVEFEHVVDLRKNQLPPNVAMYEWMFPAGAFINHKTGQRVHMASNFSDSPRDLMAQGCNLIHQMSGKIELDGKTYITPGCNSECIGTMEMPGLYTIGRERRERGENILFTAEISKHSPFFFNDIMKEPHEFDIILEGPEVDNKPFNIVKEPIQDTHHMMGHYASMLVKDGGTLQVGIGSLGDAITNGIMMRHKHNDVFKKLTDKTGIMGRKGEFVEQEGGLEPFEEGIFCNSEMFVDSFLDLIDEGIIKRRVYDDVHIQRLLNSKKISEDVDLNMIAELYRVRAIGSPIRDYEVEYLKKFGILKQGVSFDRAFLSLGDVKVSTDLDVALEDEAFKQLLGDKLQGGELIHSTLALATRDLYERINEMPLEKKRDFSMRGIRFCNTLMEYQDMKIAQRKDGRYINFSLVATVTGAIASETIEHQQVLSGVGGQLDFIQMANFLDDGRSLIIINATRGEGKEVKSNVVFEYSGCTAPRQLRDIIITEYGFADLRARRDEDCVKEMIKIADSRFQDELIAEAKKYNKLSPDWELPQEFRNNTPESVSAKLKEFKDQGYYDPFPFGCTLTPLEVQLGGALKKFVVNVRDSKVPTMMGVVSKLFAATPDKFKEHIERMDLTNPTNFNQRFQRAVVLKALEDQLG